MCQSVSYGDPEEMAKDAMEHVRRGFRTLKIYCGRGSPQSDLERIRSIRNAVGKEIDLYVEANQRWTLKTVLGLLPRFEELDVLFLEQPIHSRSFNELRILRERSSIPVALDETVFSPEDVLRACQKGIADIVNIYVLKAGGIHNAAKSLEIAASAGIDAFVGSFNELGISTMAGAHVAATIKTLSYPCYLVGPMLYEEDILREPPDIRDGKFHLPDRPGLGIDVDEKQVKRLSI